MKQQYWDRRHAPAPKVNMTGVEYIGKKCYCCHQYKRTGGCKMVDIGGKSRVFVCHTCVEEGKHHGLRG